MQHKQRDYDDDDFSEIWRSAQHRRSEDIYFWFTHFFGRQRQLKPSDSRLRSSTTPQPLLVWKLLDASRAVWRMVY